MHFDLIRSNTSDTSSHPTTSTTARGPLPGPVYRAKVSGPAVDSREPPISGQRSAGIIYALPAALGPQPMVGSHRRGRCRYGRYKC
ncbi:hypothetical protein T06_10437 [Trichinella sp. T6]|nr:hypothetical protein T06_10437 [Trichinella sp. T6]